MSKAKSENESNESTEGQATDAQGNVLTPGTVVPAAQDQSLADRGIYQPRDQQNNAPGGAETYGATSEEDKKIQEEHRKNVAKLPPVPSERAGGASQAK
jgi:hypothetical protein